MPYATWCDCSSRMSRRSSWVSAHQAADLRIGMNAAHRASTRAEHPFIVWAPGLMVAKSVGMTNEKSVVVGMDLVPSLLELAGVRSEVAFDGENKAATLLGKEQAIRTAPIFWRRPPDRPGPKQNPFPDLSMRQGDWKLLCMFDGSSPSGSCSGGDVGAFTGR